MQIFEITNNKKLDEVNLGAFVKGVGSQLAKNVKSDLGIQPADNQVSGVAAQNAATKATAGVVKQQAQAQQHLWSKTLQTMTAAASQAGTAQIDPQALATNLNKQIQGMIKPHGLTASIKPMNGRPVPQIDDFTDQIDPEMLDATTKAQVAQNVAQINQSIASILAAPPDATASDLTNAWMSLAQGIADAGSMTTFHANPGGGGGRVAGSGTDRSIPPALKPVVTALGTDSASMQKFARLVQASGKPVKATGNPQIDSFLTQSGIRLT